jgi:hypothetical protein
MVDYDKATGTGGTLRIRDTGSAVEYWVLCSNPATFVGSFVWSGVVNGAPVGGTTTLPAGFGSQLLGSWTVSTTQNVTFHMNNTGTGGLGGPTDHAADIPRGPVGTIPDAPIPEGFTDVTTTSMTYHFHDGSDGGSSITSRAVEYATSADFSTGSSGWVGVGSSGVVPVSGLVPGVLYYWRARVQNANGVSPNSAVISQRTLGGVYVSDGTVWKPAEVLVSDGTAWKPATVGVSDGIAWKPTA